MIALEPIHRHTQKSLMRNENIAREMDERGERSFERF